jgi:hypothetical protein
LVCSALACQVIGPLSPAMWQLTESCRPARSGAAGLRTKPRATASLQTEAPGAIVMLLLLPKVTGRLLALATAAPPTCRP